MREQMYDLIIIGGGPAGYHAAEGAAHEKMKVLLCEERKLGGVCLNEGCVPSKALLYSAKIFDYARGGGARFGVTCERPILDYAAAVRRKDGVVRQLAAGIEQGLKKDGVQIVREHAVVAGRVSGGYAVRAGNEAYETAKLLLCAGSEALLPPIRGLRESIERGFGMTNREILDIIEIPQHLVIVGGGVIGMEMASLFNSAGAEVTVIEMLDKIAGPTDREISAILQKNYEKKGVKFLLNAKCTAVGLSDVTCEQDGKPQTIHCDKVLFSIGRRPVTRNLGLESIGVLTERESVVTDERQQTNIPGVYAAGDINGQSMLAHTAYREAEVAVNSMCGRKDRMDYGAIPSVIYTNPEVACVGETLETAKEKGVKAAEQKLSMTYSGRYMAENEQGDGLCKLVWDGKRLIGVHMLGNPSSEIISTASTFLSREISLEQMKRVVFPHPTVAEILHQALYQRRDDSRLFKAVGKIVPSVGVQSPTEAESSRKR